MSEPVDFDHLREGIDPEIRAATDARTEAFERVVRAQRLHDAALIRYARRKVTARDLLELVTSGATTDDRESARKLVSAGREWHEALMAYAQIEGIDARNLAEVLMGGARAMTFDPHDDLWLRRRR